MNESTTESTPADGANDMPLPLGICAECCASEMKGDNQSGVIICYCRHNQSGAFWKPQERQWRIDTPITEQAFYTSAYLGIEKADEAINRELV